MVNRKKRLQKGIDSIENQLKIHEEKFERAEKEGNIELAGYYRKKLKKLNRIITFLMIIFFPYLL